MNFNVTTKTINYHLDEKDEDRVFNCDGPLIDARTFTNGFIPQLPHRCIQMAQRLQPQMFTVQRGDELEINVPVPVHPYHLNSFASIAQIQEKAEELQEGLPENMEYYTWNIAFQDKETEEVRRPRKNKQK